MEKIHCQLPHCISRIRCLWLLTWVAIRFLVSSIRSCINTENLKILNLVLTKLNRLILMEKLINTILDSNFIRIRRGKIQRIWNICKFIPILPQFHPRFTLISAHYQSFWFLFGPFHPYLSQCNLHSIPILPRFNPYSPKFHLILPLFHPHSSSLSPYLPLFTPMESFFRPHSNPKFTPYSSSRSVFHPEKASFNPHFIPILPHYSLFHPHFTLVSPSFHPHFTPLLALFNSFWAVSPLLTPMKSLFHLYFTPISPPFHPHFTLRSPIKYLSDLSHNELTVCESNGFKPLSKLEILKLNNNSISTLEEKAFIGLYAIREM